MVRTNSLIMWSNPYLPNPVIQGPNNAIKLGNNKTSKSHTKLHAHQNSYCFSTHTCSHLRPLHLNHCHLLIIKRAHDPTAISLPSLLGSSQCVTHFVLVTQCITVKNTVGKTYQQHLTTVFWLFTLHNILCCSDSSEETTASIFPE